MPVVLVTVGGRARSGHIYDDRTGVSYEYPRGRYERWIKPGERFVYQRPRHGYVGCGIIGNISQSETAGRLVCETYGVVSFDNPVPLKDHRGEYYEADGQHWQSDVYWGQGVRPLSNARFEMIVAAARHMQAAPSGYASAAVARAVEDYSVRIAKKMLLAAYPGTPIHQMPHNNPGFDIRLGTGVAPIRYVEVKGTQAYDPVFFLSEGERKFSVLEADRYMLIVVTGISLDPPGHSDIVIHEGSVDQDSAALAPVQWTGRLPSKR